MPHNLGRLTDLQTLNVFHAGEDDERSVRELQNLNLIKGELWLMGLHKVKDLVQTITTNLSAKNICGFELEQVFTLEFTSAT